MRHDKLERELNLLILLTENHDYTVEEACSRLQISRRNFYYYLEFFRLAGFKVEHRKPYYRISKDSPFFRKLDELVHFTEDEAITLRRVLDMTGDQSLQVQRLRRKLERLYDLDILDSVELQEQQAHNLTALYDAIKRRVTVKLVNYSSPHSNTVSDRVVEPFLLLNGNREVRCYEISSGKNKTFKLSRMEDVVLTELLWHHEKMHKPVKTDVFMFSDDEHQIVTLRMGFLATHLMREEFPKAEKYIESVDDTHWVVNIPVCSFQGIGRFVLGLFQNIDVIGPESFKEYLRNQIKLLNEKIL